EARAEELRAAGAAASAHVADLTVRAEAFALVEAVEREHGRLDVLVNAAGIAQSGIPAPDAAFADLTEAEWRRELDVNLMTAVYTTQAALPGMARRDYGRSGVTANSVAPGWIDTASSLDDELVAARSTPVGRAGTAAEAASVAVFLASEEAAYV